MRILFVHANVRNTAGSDIVQALNRIGYEAQEFPGLQTMPPSQLEDNRVKELEEHIRRHNTDLLISIYFVMNAALAAYKTKIRYVSVLWDAPVTDVYNPLGRLDNVWISTFDQLERIKFLRSGIRNVLYQPLSVNETRALEWNHEIQETLQGNYFHDISFIGSLYDDNPYDRYVQKFPKNMQYYFNSIFEEAAFKWDGENRIYGKTGKEILEYLQMAAPEFGIFNRQDIDDVHYFEEYVWLEKWPT